MTPLPVVRSPKFHAYATIDPSVSLLDDASKLTVCPMIGPVGVKVKAAVGGRSWITLSDVAEAVFPLLSVIVRVTV